MNTKITKDATLCFKHVKLSKMNAHFCLKFCPSPKPLHGFSHLVFPHVLSWKIPIYA